MMTFEAWKAKVDDYLRRMYGTNSDGIADWDYYEAYENRVMPSKAAIMAFKNAKREAGY